MILGISSSWMMIYWYKIFGENKKDQKIKKKNLFNFLLNKKRDVVYSC